MKKQETVPKIVNVDCVRCKLSTQHEVLQAHEETGCTKDDIFYTEEFQIIRCMGCQNICFKKSEWNSEDYDLNDGSIEHIHVYPKPGERKPSVDQWMLPDHVRILYDETLICSNAQAPILAAAGLRSVVEATCIDQGCNAHNLMDKIDELVTKGVLLKREADCFHQHRFLGNEAVHEMEVPPKKEFEIALEILEHLLTTIYILPHRNKTLQKLRAARGAKVQ